MDNRPPCVTLGVFVGLITLLGIYNGAWFFVMIPILMFIGFIAGGIINGLQDLILEVRKLRKGG